MSLGFAVCLSCVEGGVPVRSRLSREAPCARQGTETDHGKGKPHALRAQHAASPLIPARPHTPRHWLWLGRAQVRPGARVHQGPGGPPRRVRRRQRLSHALYTCCRGWPRRCPSLPTALLAHRPLPPPSPPPSVAAASPALAAVTSTASPRRWSARRRTRSKLQAAPPRAACRPVSSCLCLCMLWRRWALRCAGRHAGTVRCAVVCVV